MYRLPLCPQVTHGHTLCNLIPFEDVLHAVDDCGFVTSPLPIVLSLEMHCKAKGQARIPKRDSFAPQCPLFHVAEPSAHPREFISTGAHRRAAARTVGTKASCAERGLADTQADASWPPRTSTHSWQVRT